MRAIVLEHATGKVWPARAVVDQFGAAWVKPNGEQIAKLAEPMIGYTVVTVILEAHRGIRRKTR